MTWPTVYGNCHRKDFHMNAPPIRIVLKILLFIAVLVALAMTLTDRAPVAP